MSLLRCLHQELFQLQVPRVEAHVADASGQGKSHGIATTFARTAGVQHVQRVLFGGPFVRQTMVQRLTPAQQLADEASLAYHFDLHDIQGEQLDAVLLEILVVGRLYDPTHQRMVFVSPSSHVALEVANSLDQR